MFVKCLIQNALNTARRAVVERNERGSTFSPMQKHAQAKVTRMEYLFTLSVLRVNTPLFLGGTPVFSLENSTTEARRRWRHRS